MRPDLIRTLRAAVSPALPTLRTIGLVYTGLAGVAGMLLVVAVALTPTTPILQQVAEPARQAVTSFVQPTGDLVTGIISQPSVPLVIRPSAPVSPAPAFLDVTTLQITIDQAAATEEAPVETADTVQTVAPAPAPRLIVQQIVPVVEEEPVDTETADDAQLVEAPVAEPEVVRAPEPQTLQIAAAEEPQALPTPTLTAEQQNHVIIEANKAAAAQAKAEADAANAAAIAAEKAATAQARAAANAANAAAIAAANAPAMAGSSLQLPTQSATPNKAAVDSAKRTAAEAAKTAAAQSKADADAANAAAIAAARAAAPKH